MAAPPPPLLRDLANLPLVGRANERSALLYGLQTAVQGHGGMALIEGDAGVGKTRLASAIVSDAEWRGFEVGLGKADPLAAAAPTPLPPRSAILAPMTWTCSSCRQEGAERGNAWRFTRMATIGLRSAVWLVEPITSLWMATMALKVATP